MAFTMNFPCLRQCPAGYPILHSQFSSKRKQNSLRRFSLSPLASISSGGDNRESIAAKPAAGPINTSENQRESANQSSESSSRRSFAQYIAMSVFSLFAVEKTQAEGGDTQALELTQYQDGGNGFTLLRPKLWEQVDKAGATVLFEDPGNRSNTIGVVVNSVKIPSLREFGSVNDVAQKLIAAEKKKESTKEAQLIQTMTREAQGGVPLYAVEYSLNSTRGSKRILTAVTISSSRLFILNISFPDSEYQPADPTLKASAQLVLDSFDLTV